jgi:hypothetical protein
MHHTEPLLSKQQRHQVASRQQQQQQQQQQALQEEPSLQSVNSLSMFPDPSVDGGCSSKAAAAGAAGAGRDVLSVLNVARLQEERQHALVVSACKALGSSTAADAYVAALPAGLLAVNLSAAGEVWALGIDGIVCFVMQWGTA